MNGLFFTFEGIEGCGKSTQARLLAEYLQKKGKKVVLTREPGGTDLGSGIRKLILESPHVFDAAELLLFLADRNQHVHETIIPSLESGSIIICDRYYHSTYAYQSGGRKIDAKTVRFLNEFAIEGIRPDMTFLLDIPVETGFARKKSGNLRLDRIEKEELTFHSSIRNAYLEMAKEEKNFLVINGEENPEIIHKKITGIINDKFTGL